MAEFGGWVGVFLGKKISTTYIALSWPSLYCHNTHIGSIADANIINPLCMNGICHFLKTNSRRDNKGKQRDAWLFVSYIEI